MRCRLAAILGLLFVSACGQTRVTVDDDRPPPFRDHGVLTFWTTNGPDRPTDETLIEDLAEFRVPVLLLPSAAGTTVSLEIYNLGLDVFVATAATTTELRLRVTSSNQTESVACEGVPTVVRGRDGCFSAEEPGRLVLSWDEEWVHQARWTQDPAASAEENLDVHLEWLEGWRALRP
jgi:hypothetical protein